MWRKGKTAMIVTMMTVCCVTSVSGIIATMVVVLRSPSFEATSPNTRIAIAKVVIIIVRHNAAPGVIVFVFVIIIEIFVSVGIVPIWPMLRMASPSSTFGSSTASIHDQRLVGRLATASDHFSHRTRAAPSWDAVTTTMGRIEPTTASLRTPVRNTSVPDVRWPYRIVYTWFSSRGSWRITALELIFTVVMWGKASVAVLDVPLGRTQSSKACKILFTPDHIGSSD